MTFEPGCHNNWHIHHADKGAARFWSVSQGAAKDSRFSHLAVEVPGENGSNEWQEPVMEEKYSLLK